MKHPETYREINWATISVYMFFVLAPLWIILLDPDLELDFIIPDIWFYVCIFVMISALIELSNNAGTELTVNDRHVIINEHLFGLFATTINYKDIITIMRDPKPPKKTTNHDVREAKWFGFGYDYPDRILIRYIEEGREKEYELYVKDPDKLFDWLKRYVCPELSQSPTVKFDDDTTILFHRKGTYHDSYE